MLAASIMCSRGALGMISLPNIGVSCARKQGQDADATGAKFATKGKA
jgi:hypothetical protein